MLGGYKMGRIIEMISDCYEQGYSTQQIKDMVISKLTPLFSNKDNAEKYWTTAEMLSVFEFIMRYHHDETFMQFLQEVLTTYRVALERNSENVMQIFCDSLFDFSQKENMMWTVRENVKQVNSDDYDESVIRYLKHIGDTLEIGTKHIIAELYAIVLIADGKTPDYEKIQRFDFGVNVQNILAQGKFQGMLLTDPINIKLSDWRNIAYHHTYRIIDKDTIVCTYGKKQQTFSISFDELLQYTYQIVKASNILNIARSILVYDYDEKIADYRSAHGHTPVRFRPSILEENLRTSMMSMGFYLSKVEVNDNTAVAVITDLRNNGGLGRDEQIIRHIHASQFLYHLWNTYRKKEVCINYYSASGRFIFSCSVAGSVCERIGREDKELSHMAQFVSFDYGE